MQKRTEAVSNAAELSAEVLRPRFEEKSRRLHMLGIKAETGLGVRCMASKLEWTGPCGTLVFRLSN